MNLNHIPGENGEFCEDSRTEEERSSEQESAPEKRGASSEEQTVVLPPKKKKYSWLWNILLIAAIALGLYFLFRISNEITKEDGKSFGEAIQSVRADGVVVLLSVIFGVMVCDCLKFCVINRAVTGKTRLPAAIKTSFLGKYYDAVTPYSSGGQPMQIYYMTTKGVNGGNSTAIVLIRYFVSIFSWVILGAVCMAVGAATGVLDEISSGSLLLVAGWVGLGVNLIIPFFLLFFVVFPKIARKLTALFVTAGAKLKIVKDRNKAMEKAEKYVADFTAAFRIMVRRPVHLILLIVVCFGEATLTFSVPYFVMKMFSCDVDGMFFYVMALNVFATFGVSFIPTPGNSGVAESMGVLAFSLAAGATLSWSVLFWRFSVYYLYILIGVGITVFDLIVKNVGKKKGSKNE